jgi:uncharacterized protein (DUF3084 family)
MTQTTDSYGYSTDFVNQLEKRHDTAISNYCDRIRSQEENHHRVCDSFNKQIATLREQVEIANQALPKETRRLREEHDAKLQSVLRDKEASEQNLRNRLHDLTSVLEEERSQSADYRRELTRLKQTSDEEISQLQSQLRSVHAESSQVPTLRYAGFKREQELIERDRMVTEKTTHFDEIRRQFEAQMTELKLRLEGKDSLLMSMEQELNDARRQLSGRGDLASRDLLTLQDALKSARKLLEIQEQELQHLKTDREESRKEGRLLSKEAAVLEHELAHLRRENLELKAQNKRMQKLVYGRSPRKNTK